MTLKSIIYVVIFTLFALLQNGCMLPAKIATDIEKASLGKQVDQSKVVFRKHIAALQAKGDPLGDYYYALGNSDGWIKEVQDPQAITALFEKAAAKGSMDARILLALQEATSEPIPGRLDYSKGPRENLVAWEAGLTKLLPLLQQQCYVQRLGMGDGILSEARPQVFYYSIAYDIWPTFRDGHSKYTKTGEWITVVHKNPERQQIWETIDRQCKFPPQEMLDTKYSKRK
jgi:hypothetical protein